jgi:hypothetical protein
MMLFLWEDHVLHLASCYQLVHMLLVGVCAQRGQGLRS